MNQSQVARTNCVEAIETERKRFFAAVVRAQRISVTLFTLVVGACSQPKQQGAEPLASTSATGEELSVQTADRLIPLRFVILQKCGGLPGHTTPEYGDIACSGATTCSTPLSVSHCGETPSTQCAPYQFQDVPLDNNVPQGTTNAICAGTPCTELETYNIIQSRVDYANEVFKPAGIQFYIKKFERYASYFFGDAGATRAKTWASVRGELSQFLPIECDAFADNKLLSPRTWLKLASTYYSDPSEILVILPQTSNTSTVASGTGDYPAEGRSIHIPRYFIPAYAANFAHELGHYLGLPHAFRNYESCFYYPPPSCNGTAKQLDVAPAGFVDPIVDPVTDSPISSVSHFWDLLYGTTSTNTATNLFASQSQAAAWEVSGGSLNQKNIWYLDPAVSPASGLNRSNCEYVNPLTRTDVRCQINGTWYTTPAAELEALDFSGTGAERTSNVMTYDIGIFDHAPNNMLSKSQIAFLRKNLRYNVHSRLFFLAADLPIHGSHAGDIPWGDRPLLGRNAVRSLASDLDFNGDGLRDLAVWEPPALPGMLGKFTIRLATAAIPPFVPIGFAAPVSFPLGHEGDIPLPQDMNGDGKTDLVVITKRYRSQMFDDSVKWLVRYCTPSGSSISCPDTGGVSGEPGSNVAQLGKTGDVFLPKFDYDGNPATSEIALFRPSTSTFFWCTPGPAATCALSQRSKQVGPTDGSAVVPLPGLYDDDEISDLVVYAAAEGKFYVLRSGGSGSTYGGVTATHFWGTYPHVPQQLALSGPYRSGSIPIQNLTYLNSTGVPRLALGLWNPDQRQAYINWAPISSTATPTPCTAFGSGTDVPLPSGINLVAPLSPNPEDNHSDLLLMSPAPDSSSTGALNFAQLDGTCSYAAYPTATKLSGLIKNNKMVFVTSDWSGDGKPDILIVDQESMTWTGYPSPSFSTAINIGSLGNNSSSLL